LEKKIKKKEKEKEKKNLLFKISCWDRTKIVLSWNFGFQALGEGAPTVLFECGSIQGI